MLDLYKLQIIESITIVIAYVLIRLLFASLIKRSAKKFSYQKRRITLIRKATYLFISCLAFLLILLVWGVKQHELFFFMSSTITVIGVAFFAQWSLLSNTTASLIIFLNHPIKIGDKIEIIEEDDNMSRLKFIGKIKKGEKIHLRYRVLVHSGTHETANIAGEFKKFEAENSFNCI